MGPSLNNYRNMLNETFDSVSRAIGVHVLLLVTEHALWKTKHKYEEASLIVFSEEGINIENLNELDSEKAQQIARELVMAIISTLGRLVGMQLAHQLTESLLDNKEGLD
ncbi:MAG: hypothetical protein ACYC2T_05235 [Bacillota bacterium]